MTAKPSLFPHLLAAGFILWGAPALAHHPGSHATRQGSTVSIEAVALATESCATLGAAAFGAPPAVTAPAGATPVTVRLARPPGAACAGAVTRVSSQTNLPAPADLRLIMLYILAPDGSILSSERVPVR